MDTLTLVRIVVGVALLLLAVVDVRLFVADWRRPR